MKIGVVIFPGSNCDRDLIRVLNDYTSQPILQLWHKDTDLQGCTHIFLPGGFTYGDYLRTGAIAKLSPIMESVKNHANAGGFVMGICNGFQILCESGLLPGALLRNTNRQFICENVYLKPGSNQTAINKSLDTEKTYCIPIAHGEGRFYCDESTHAELMNNNQIIFRYADANGNVNDSTNPNGSIDNIAGICNEGKNVFGMMPHPERAYSDFLLNTDGKSFFNSLFDVN